MTLGYRIRTALGTAIVATASCAAPKADQPPRAEANSQRTPAGELVGGQLRLRLTLSLARWFVEADSGPSVVVRAFGEESRPPQLPGPLVRIPAGTRVNATVRNDLPDTMVVIGLGGPERQGRDTMWLAPRAVGRIESVAAIAGTFGYYARAVTGGKVQDRRPGDQMFGSFLVDSAGTPPDRVFTIDAWVGPPVSTGDTAVVLVFNGKSWPHTERLDLAVGDTLRLRVLNATESEHPMHLHGFYYRVDARGTWHSDTTYGEGQRRLVVTESLRPRETMALTWVPDRPGNWLFHCHVAFHIAGEQHQYLVGQAAPDEPVHAGPEHVQRDMAGLVIGIRVSGDSVGARPSPTVGIRERHRITVVQRPTPYHDGTPAFGYSVDGREPATPNEPLVLTRGVATAVTVTNRMTVPTAIHWHGIELESFYDGVAGWSGAGQRLAPLIAPGDSFVAVMTPPRSGTFIYHAHIDDSRQLASGLVAPLLVLPPGARPDPERDHIWLFSQAGTSDSAPVVVNAGRPLPPLRAGGHRIRVVNITAGDELDFQLFRGDELVSWRAIAKDGADLPPSQATDRPSRLHMGPGETWDFGWTAEPGRYRLVVKSFNDFEATFTVR